MKPSVVILLVAAVGLGALSTTGCLASRRSEGYACNTDADCRDPERSCENGYCVLAPCPSPCTSCDLVDKTCQIDCTVQGRPCNAVQCPAGFDCTIRCTKSNVCAEIDCSQSNSCDITCSAVSACGAITCGAGPCDVTCSDQTSCGDVDCAGSCRCDVSCSNASCPSMMCPQPAGAVCTRNSGSTAVCDSSAGLACDTCL